MKHKQLINAILIGAICAFTLTCNSIFCSHAHANTADKQLIVVVNVQKIVSQSLASNHVKKQLETKREEYQKAIDRQEEQLREKDKELASQRSLLDPEAYKAQVTEFKKKVASVQKDVQDKRSQMDKAYAKALSKIQDVTINVISNLSKNKGFDIAVPTNNILFAKQGLDISEDVLKELNTRLPKLDVVFTKEEDNAAKKKLDKKS